MADDVQVNFGAQLGSLLGGLKQATDGVKDFSNQSKAAILGLTAPFEKLQSTLLAVAAIAAGGAVFKEIVQGALESTSVALKLSKTFGLTLDAASQLRVELDGLGVSAEDYTSMALRMDRQLRTNESSLRAMGLQTRDANGNILGQQELLKSGVEWLRGYKEGADRNIAAQTLFGRNIGEVNSLLKMTAATAAKAKQDMKDLGLITTPEDVARAREYKLAMNQLGLSFEGIKDAIGNAVLPYLTKFAQWFREVTPTIISNMKTYATDVVSFALQLVKGLGDFAIGVLQILDNVGAGFDNLKTRAAAAGAGAIVGGSIGAFAGGIGALPGAAIGAGLGWFAGQDDKNNDKFAASQKKFEEIRKMWEESFAKFKAMVEAGGPELGPKPEAPPSGSKSANGLVQMQDQVKAAQLRIQGEIQALQNGLAMKKVILDAEVSMYGLSQDEKFAALQKETAKEAQLEIQKLEEMKRIGALTIAQRMEIENKIKDLKSKTTQTLIQLDIQSLEAMKAKFNEVFDQIQSSFGGQLRGLLAGTTKWKDALKTVFADLIIFFIQQIIKMGFQWLATQLAMTTATTSGAAARATAEAAAGTAGSTVDYTRAVAAVLRSSVQTFAGIFANLAPVMGPLAAGPAAAGQATVAASVATMPPPFEQGAFEIPGTMQALLHPGEMVLPAAFAQSLRMMVSGQGSNPMDSGGGGPTIIKALDAHSFNRLMMRRGSTLMKSLKRQVREGRK